MDDDIKDFYRGANNVNVKISAKEALATFMERALKFPAAALYSFEYSFYAWQYNDDAVAINSYNNIAVLVNASEVPPDVSYRFRVREDYDFTLQLIRQGRTTVRFRNLSYAVPSMAASPGGMTDYYEHQKEDIRLQNEQFLRTWPSVAREVVKGTNGNERFDINVKWTLLNPRSTADPAEILRSSTPLNVAPIAGTEHHQGTRKGERKTTKRMRCPSSLPSPVAEGEAAVALERPKPVSLPKPKPKPGWKGWAMEWYREVSSSLARKAGLVLIPPEKVRNGDVVAIIPTSLSLPSVVTACVIDTCKVRPAYEWTVVVERIRGIPLQVVTACFTVPENMDSVREAIDFADDTDDEQRQDTPEDAAPSTLRFSYDDSAGVNVDVSRED
jgi:hypothetical protein